MKKTIKVSTTIVISYMIIATLAVISSTTTGIYHYLNNDFEKLAGSVAAVLVQLAACMGSLFYIYRRVSRPIKEIHTATRRMLTGDMDTPIGLKMGANEFAQLIDEINELMVISRREASVVNQIANGDLTMDVKPKSDKDILGTAIVELIRDNNDILSNIKESTMQVTAGAEQVSDASQALAQGSTEQASAIEQITASLDEIAEKTKRNASMAASADQLVHEVRSASENGKEHMGEMLAAMNAINDSSESISKVIKVIDDIAFQTNLLALNATVEAARAGVHGKGFAVVAEEVRNLAEKSAAAANETGEMIQDSIKKVHNGSEHAKNTSAALDGIYESIGKTVDLIDNIAAASNEQATAVTQIDQAILQVSQVVQTNSATSEECASASEELANQAENLRDLMSKYKLKEVNYNSAIYAPKKSSFTANSPKRKEKNENERIISLDGNFGKY